MIEQNQAVRLTTIGERAHQSPQAHRRAADPEDHELITVMKGCAQIDRLLLRSVTTQAALIAARAAEKDLGRRLLTPAYASASAPWVRRESSHRNSLTMPFSEAAYRQT